MLPEFLRLPPGPTEPALSSPALAKGCSKRALPGNGRERAPCLRETRGPAQDCHESPGTSPGSADSPPSCAPRTPTAHRQGAEAADVQTMEGEHVADLTLTGEGDISSPNSTLLPPPPTPQDLAAPTKPGTSRFESLAHL